MVETEKVDHAWPHLEWWNFLLTIFKQRCDNAPSPLIAQWIPAHVLDKLPLSLITEADARQHKTTTYHIMHNRLADDTAKKTMKDHERPF